MYVWKLWHDSRARLLSCALLGILWVAVALWLQISTLTTDAARRAAWNFLAANVQTPLVIVSLLAAMLLSEVLLGAEFAKNTAEVLLTRPRRRRYFAWASWLFVILEILAVMYLMVGCAITVLAYISGTVMSWRVVAMPVLLLPGAALLFGLSYLLSSISNGRQGAVLAFGALIAYYSAVALITQHWHIHYPPRWWFDALSFWAAGGQLGTFPSFAVLGWTAAALAFPYLVQRSIERKEI